MNKIKLIAVQRQFKIIRTKNKEFRSPYFETVFEGPIISLNEEDEIELYEFLKTFNTYLDLDWVQNSYEHVHFNGGKKYGAC